MPRPSGDVAGVWCATGLGAALAFAALSCLGVGACCFTPAAESVPFEDGGPTIDGGPTLDGGSSLDAGPPPDAGLPPDSGLLPDGGSPPDGGPAPDSGPNDAGPGIDGGPTFCTIGGSPYPSRASNPSDARQCCNPAANPGGWTQWLIPGPAYPVGSGAASGANGLVAADLDGDGRSDLAVAAYNDNTVSVFLQQVNGGFVRQPDLAAGTNVNSVTARRMPGTVPDLVATNAGESTVSVFVNRGGGAFAPQTTITFPSGVVGLPSSPLQCLAGSWTGAAAPDLVCALLNNSEVALLPALADGGFGQATSFGPLVFQPWEMTAADFRGKGLLDLAITFWLDIGEFSILPADGKGGFGAERTYYGEHDPYSVAAADCDGDGLIDLLVTHYHDNDIGFRKGNGDGTFAAPVLFGVGKGPQGITTADLNGDSWPDVIVASSESGTLDVLWNQGAQGGWATNGLGGFSAPASFQVVSAGGGPGRVISEYFNQDGAPDLAATHDGTVQVFLNGCP